MSIEFEAVFTVIIFGLFGMLVYQLIQKDANKK